MNEKGNYVLAILKTTENYDNLKESLADLTEEMSKLNKVKVRGKSYNIKQFLGGIGSSQPVFVGQGELTKSMHAFGANVLITRGISKGYGHFPTVFRGLHHWRKFQNLPNQKSTIAGKALYSISHHLIM